MAIITFIIQFIGRIQSLVGAIGKKGNYALHQNQFTVAKRVVEDVPSALSSLLTIDNKAVAVDHTAFGWAQKKFQESRMVVMLKEIKMCKSVRLEAFILPKWHLVTHFLFPGTSFRSYQSSSTGALWLSSMLRAKWDSLPASSVQ